jgi:SOS-response transcriptional repressor LexA
MVTLTKNMVPEQDGLYALRARGNSMSNEGIRDGDIVIIKPYRFFSDAKDGHKVIAHLISKDEFTLKNLYREKRGRIRLQPASIDPHHEPIYTRISDIELQGRVIAVIHSEVTLY